MLREVGPIHELGIDETFEVYEIQRGTCMSCVYVSPEPAGRAAASGGAAGSTPTPTSLGGGEQRPSLGSFHGRGVGWCWGWQRWERARIGGASRA
jgi:hypothetical protein